jgi:3,4-dihydroxyphenylacetate 2,3-dioxygenase
MGELAGVFLTAHTPRFCTLPAAFEGKVAHEAFRPVRDALVAQGERLRATRPDVVLVNSCHLISTFPTVVDGTPRHRGVLTAQEAPELIHGVAYDYMPMVCYLDPAQRLPMVPISVCLHADLDESHAWGRHVAALARERGKRVAFVASGSLSHKLVRGPERGPRPEDEELDRRLVRLLLDGEYDKAWQWLPAYAEAADPEMGGRHLAMLLGVLLGSGSRYAATLHGYGPSSGSGNAVISFVPGA